MTRRRPTLQRRLAALTAAVVAIAVVGLSVVSWILLRVQLIDETGSTLRESAGRIAMRSDPLRFPSAPPWARPDVDTLFGVVQPNGTALRPGFQRDALPTSAVDIAVANGLQRDAMRTVRVSDTDYLMLTVHGHHRAIQLARDLSDVEETLNRFAVVLVAADAVVVALTVTLGYALTRTGLRPVQKVRKAAEHVADTQDLDAAVPITDRDPSEVASVAASVNSMLTALAASRDAQRQLIDDAGHELATPLTSLRTNIDLLVRAENRPEQVLDPDDRRTLLGDLQAQMGELTDLIDEIVELARDPRTAEEQERLDLADVLTAAVTRARARTPAAEFVVDSTSVPLSGGRAALERAVLNLLDNAAKFGGDRPIEVTLRRADGHASLVVADRGVGIKESDARQVFERFHRSQDARSLPGSGLGLSIVAQVMAAHGGRAWLTPRKGGGAEAHLEFPLIR